MFLINYKYYLFAVLLFVISCAAETVKVEEVEVIAKKLSIFEKYEANSRPRRKRN
jgi:hypothetical protein